MRNINFESNTFFPDIKFGDPSHFGNSLKFNDFNTDSPFIDFKPEPINFNSLPVFTPPHKATSKPLPPKRTKQVNTPIKRTFAPIGFSDPIKNFGIDLIGDFEISNPLDGFNLEDFNLSNNNNTNTPPAHINTPNIVNTATNSKLKITGVVKDAATGETLPYVLIASKDNPTIFTETDENGKFIINANPNEKILVSFNGYKDVIINALELQGGTKLENQGYVTDEIIVKTKLNKKPNYWLYGGIGLGVLALGYLVLSKPKTNKKAGLKGAKNTIHVTL